MLPTPDPLGELRRAAAAVRRRVCAAPLTAPRLADAAIGRHFRRRDRVAATDPTWAAIEARRQTSGPAVTFLSKEKGLGLVEWETQQRIEAALCPDPWWLPLARRVSRWHLPRVSSAVRHARQRAARGWSDADWWSAGHHLVSVAAGMLEHMAEHSTGWPKSEEFPDFEDWTAALRHNAALLRHAIDLPGEEEATARWYAAASDPDAPEGLADELFEQSWALVESNREAAREGLRWVADHLECLWD